MTTNTNATEGETKTIDMTIVVPTEIELITASTSLYALAGGALQEAKNLEDDDAAEDAKVLRTRATELQTVVRYLDAIRMSTYG